MECAHENTIKHPYHAISCHGIIWHPSLLSQSECLCLTIEGSLSEVFLSARADFFVHIYIHIYIYTRIILVPGG